MQYYYGIGKFDIQIIFGEIKYNKRIVYNICIHNTFISYINYTE